MIPRPSIQFMRAIVHAFYELEGNIVGGSLHIVIEDYNIEDSHIMWCRNYALEKQDMDGVLMCDLLLLFTEDEREKILEL